MTNVRKGEAPGKISRVEFRKRFQQSYADPLFQPEQEALERVEEIAWYAYSMVDPLVCADGGNTDPTTTGGKNAQKAKELELAGWPYPKHLAGRVYGLVVHGDVAGIEGVRRSLSDWLDWMGLIDAGTQARLDRFIGYYEPYATSHDALDNDKPMQEEVRNVARAVVHAVGAARAGRLTPPDAALRQPRPK